MEALVSSWLLDCQGLTKAVFDYDVVRDTRVELVSEVWKTSILADIRIPQILQHYITDDS